MAKTRAEAAAGKGKKDSRKKTSDEKNNENESAEKKTKTKKTGADKKGAKESKFDAPMKSLKRARKDALLLSEKTREEEEEKEKAKKTNPNSVDSRIKTRAG